MDDTNTATARTPHFDAPVDAIPPVGPAASPSGVSYPAVPSRFRFQRSRTDRMLGGVCGGLAQSLGVDVTLLRIGLVALTVLGAGIGIVLYLAAWILAPEADATG